VPPRPRTPAARPDRGGAATQQLGTRRRATQQTTDQLRDSAGTHDTREVRQAAPRRPEWPPPPVVIPPPKRKQRTARQRRRRRGLIALLVVLLLGLGAGVAAWWYASGRYSTIPRVQGQSQSTAQAALKDAGYDVGSITRDWSETVPKNKVIGTHPGAGSRVERGKTVSIVVSNGAYRIDVPSVAKQTSEQAQQTLSERGLKVTTELVNDDRIPAGQAIRTKPAAGEKVKKDQVVTLYVSLGPPIVDIPDVKPGTPVGKVDDQLKKLGFKVTHNEDYSDTIKKGGVLKLDPSDSAVKGSTIVVTVSKGPQTVTIPDIKQFMPTDEAKAQLEALGLQVKIDNRGPRNHTQVIQMDPPAGTTVDVGSTVTLTVL
jgi:serine/threonine-protein kinase